MQLELKLTDSTGKAKKTWRETRRDATGLHCGQSRENKFPRTNCDWRDILRIIPREPRLFGTNPWCLFGIRVQNSPPFVLSPWISIVGNRPKERVLSPPMSNSKGRSSWHQNYLHGRDYKAVWWLRKYSTVNDNSPGIASITFNDRPSLD